MFEIRCKYNDNDGNGKMDIQRRCFLFNISTYRNFNIISHLLTERMRNKSGGRAEEERRYLQVQMSAAR